MVQLEVHRIKIRIIVITIMKDVRLAINIPPDIWPMNQVITHSFRVGLPATLVATDEVLLYYCTFVFAETFSCCLNFCLVSSDRTARCTFFHL